MIYDPQEDSFLLAKYVDKFSKGKVLDLGTGSGIQSEIALRHTKDVLAVDIDKESINFVKKKKIKSEYSNLFSNVNEKFDLIIFNPPYLPEEELEDKESINFIKKKKIKTLISDLFSKINEKFDLIIFNPPYLPEEELEDKESKKITTGGKYGYEILERFFSQVNKYLNKDGKILIVFSSLTNKNKIDKIIRQNNFKFKLLEEQKMFFEKLYCYLIERKWEK